MFAWVAFFFRRVYIVRPTMYAGGGVRRRDRKCQRHTQCGKLRRRRPHVLVFVRRPLKRELSRRRLVLKIQRLVTLCLNSRSQRRRRSSLIRCNLGCPKSSGRNSVTRLMRRQKRFL